MKTSERTNTENNKGYSLRNFACAILPEGTAFGVAEHPMPQSNVRYFRDNFGTEFILPGQVEKDQAFNIRLKVGNFPKNSIRQIAFLYSSDWDSSDLEETNTEEIVQVNEINLPQGFHLERDDAKSLMDHCWDVKAAAGTNKMEEPIRINLQITQPGQVICVVVYESNWAGIKNKSPHIFVMDVK